MLSLLGEGGMGTVYLCLDGMLHRKVAIKVLTARLTSDERANKRMLREARAAATLDHPHICSIYEVGEVDGKRFIAMQYVEGEPLDAKIGRNALGLQQIVDTAAQVADALAEAHAKGVIHRDIKPPNIVITPRGDVKVMDFGLAKVGQSEFQTGSEAETAAQLSTPGAIMGTVPYMSPEQVRGKHIDARSDLFSVGVLIYEMVSGQRPFKGESSAEVASSILTSEPLPLARFMPEVPSELQRIVDKLLHKDPEDRYQTARDLVIDLQTLSRDLDFKQRLERSDAPHHDADRESGSKRVGHAAVTEVMPPVITGEEPRGTADGVVHTDGLSSRRGFGLPLALLAIVGLAAVSGWWLWSRANVSWAKEQVPKIEELVRSRDYFTAFDLATQAQRYIPDDPVLATLMPTVSDSISVTSEPVGASVYLRRFQPDANGVSPSRVLVGQTPLDNLRIPRGHHILYIEKDGYSPAEMSVLGTVARNNSLTVLSPPIKVDQKLFAEPPANMVYVPGGDYRLVAWARPTDDRKRIDAFFIDKHEVSNRDYKEFVAAGGYVREQYWKVPFVKDGKVLSWQEAMDSFKDRTGLPGPREWTGQNFPADAGEHPVTGITWYEAAAYAEFRGKSLPTVFQWEKAARNGQAVAIGTFMPWGFFSPGDQLQYRANFENNGTVAVTANEFGMSPFGALNMAGNVSEWTANETTTGYLATGGSWGDPVYMFAQFGTFPPWFASAKHGFRCVRLANPETASGDQGGAKLTKEDEVPVYQTKSESEFKELAAAYRHEKAALDPQIVETIETPDWRREKITINGAEGERAILYLYLPRNAAPPFQVIHFIPAGDVENGLRPLSASAEDRLGSIIRSGRAVFGVVTKGYIERLRPPEFVYPDGRSIEYRDMLASRITDLRNGLDYLESRQDIDIKRLGFYGPSAGSRIGLILAAIEDRYSAIYMTGAGLFKRDTEKIATANPANFAPFIRRPIHILNGRYDEDTPLKTHTEPLFKLLREPKTLEVFDGGHVPPSEIQIPSLNRFLDLHLGPVRR